jgi:hypothetical protein
MMARRDQGEFPLRDFYEAVQTFISTYGKYEMPDDFVVPFDSMRWPLRLHGVKIGKHFKRLVKEGVSRRPNGQNHRTSFKQSPLTADHPRLDHGSMR